MCLRLPRKKQTNQKKKPTRRCHTHPPSQPQKRLTTWDSKSETVVLGPPAGADPPKSQAPRPRPPPTFPNPAARPASPPPHPPTLPSPHPVSPFLSRPSLPPRPAAADSPRSTTSPYTPGLLSYRPRTPHHTHTHTQTHTHAHRPSPQTTTLTVSQPGPKTVPTAEAERSRFASGAVRRLERG